MILATDINIHTYLRTVIFGECRAEWHCIRADTAFLFVLCLRRYFPLGNGCLRCRIPVNTVSRLFSYDISTLLIPVFLVERPALAVRLDLSFRSVYLFLSGNIFRTAEPISTKVCTVTASGQE